MDAAGFSRFTKIVATLGVSSSPEMLEQLTSAGVNVFRLNFSHGTQEEQGARIRAIRDLEARTGKPTCILADLQGPKHRVGVVAEGTILEVGQTLRFDQSLMRECRPCRPAAPRNLRCSPTRCADSCR